MGRDSAGGASGARAGEHAGPALDSERRAGLRGARPKRFGGRMSYCRARRAGCAPIRREAMIDRSIPLGR